MISFLEGKLEEVYNASIVLNVHGIGYEIFVTQPQQFKVNEEPAAPTFFQWNRSVPGPTARIASVDS